MIADKLHAAGWSWGYCRAITRHGWRWIVDTDREGAVGTLYRLTTS